jgi:hypothetical protein
MYSSYLTHYTISLTKLLKTFNPMKKRILTTLVCATLLTLFSCKSGYIDPLTLGFRIETTTQVVNAKKMVANEVIDTTVDIDVKKALINRGITIIDRVASFYIDTVSIRFNKDVCEKMASYEFVITYPTTPVEIVTVTKTTDDCSILTRDPTSLLSVPLLIDSNSTNAQYKRILAVDWAPIFKAGKKITVTGKVKAAQGFEKVIDAEAFLTAHGKFGL